MLSPIFGDKIYLNLVYLSCTWWFSILLLSSVFTWTSVQRSAKQFYRRKRFIEFYVVHWFIVHYKRFCCTLLKEDSRVGRMLFYKRKIRIAAICLGLQGAYIQWCKSVGGDCSVAALWRWTDTRKQIGNTQLLHRQIGPLGSLLLPPAAPRYPIRDGRFGQSDTQRVWRLVRHQTKVYLHP